MGVCARYQFDPKDSLKKAMKLVLRYVNGTTNHGLVYSRDNTTNLVGYSDADWVENCDDRKSISGRYFYVENNLFAWYNKKINCISLSIAEVEYTAVVAHNYYV